MPDRSVTFRFLAAPTDVALLGGTAVGGGRVLEWIDNTAYACAAAWSGRSCVTAFVGNVNFVRPINSGDLVEIHAALVRTGRTSMHIRVDVITSRPRLGTSAVATSCTVIFVALDEVGRPTEVPSWSPRTEQDRQRNVAAADEALVRGQVEQAMRDQQYSDQSLAPRTTLRFLATPADANLRGTTHGGVVMRWIDEAAYICATKWSESDCVAAYSGGIRFYQPIPIGHLVEVQARLLYTGTRSMHISVHVRSGDPLTREMLLTTHCLTVFVARRDDRQSTQVPRFDPGTDEDRRLEAHAKHLVALRAGLDPRHPA